MYNNIVTGIKFACWKSRQSGRVCGPYIPWEEKMEKAINRTAKKTAVIITTIVMAIAFMPAFTQDAHAGGDYDLPQPYGLNDNGTVDPQNTLTVYMSDLENANSGFKEGYEAGAVKLTWYVTKTNSFADTDGIEIIPDYDGNKFTTTVPEKYAGRYYTLYADGEYDGSNYNNNGTPIMVYNKVTVESGLFFDNGASTTWATKPLKRNFRFMIYGSFCYHWYQSTTHTVSKKIIRLFRNGKKVGQKTTSGNEVTFKNIPVSYSKKDKFKAKIFVKIGSKTIGGPEFPFKARSVKVGKNTVYATKISKNKAIVRWSGAQYANKYRVYKGSKLIKTIKKSKRKCVIKKKGAGNGKYRVIPIYKSGKKVCKGTSSKVKAQKNQVRYSRSTYYGSAPYATCPFVVTKISLKGKTYTVTGYALNNRIFNMSKYSRLTLKLRVEGKKAFSKTFRNLHVGAKDESSKKIVLRIKGRAGADLAHGGTSLSISEKPYWTWGGRHIK